MKYKTRINDLLKKVFKFLSYKLFFFIYGKITINKKLEKKIVIKKRVNFNKKYLYTIFECKKSRLYTDRIQDTAIIYNNVILSEPSFQLRNNNFDKEIKNNIVLRIGTPRVLKRINGTVVSLLTGGGANNNYFHWMFDVLPKIAILEKKYNIRDIDYFLCPNLNRWQIQTLNLIGINKKNVYLARFIDI